jgi:hypothetical protein
MAVPNKAGIDKGISGTKWLMLMVRILVITPTKNTTIKSNFTLSKMYLKGIFLSKIISQLFHRFKKWLARKQLCGQNKILCLSKAGLITSMSH